MCSIPDLIKKYSTQPTQTLIPPPNFLITRVMCSIPDQTLIRNIFIRATKNSRFVKKNTVNAGRETEEVE
jgi:hypothetical protein